MKFSSLVNTDRVGVSYSAGTLASGRVHRVGERDAYLGPVAACRRSITVQVVEWRVVEAWTVKPCRKCWETEEA